MTLNEIINLLIGWGPTILFLLIVLLATLSGIKKGVRKEAISIVHTVICFTICLILFMLLVENKRVDTMFLTLVNKILGGKGSLQSMLGVSPELKTIREVLVHYIPSQLDYVDGLELILKDNGAYLYTLVDMAYRVAFALILYVLFLILKLVCYIIYLIAYPERRHIKRVEKDFTDGLLDTGYKKHRGFGALIGASRGLVFGLVTMSFIGTIFFIAAGGDGTRRQEDVDYGDKNLNLIGNAYSSITEYGTTGIFKVFNMVKDKNDVPYYLFAADLIFSGGLKDENLQIHKHIVLRDELAAYVGFARDTYSLLLKYGGDDLRDLLKNDENAKEPMVVFSSIVSNKSFQEEFDRYIVDFDSKTYFVNLTLSLVDSIASHIDELNLGVPAEASEIIKICFKKGYLSEQIPDEKELIDKKNDDRLAENHLDRYTLDYIRPSYLINGDDFKLVLRGFFDFINKANESALEDEQANLDKINIDLTAAIIEKVKYLSIFETDKKDSLNPVMKRLYKYLDVAYLEDPNNLVTVNKLDAIDRLDEIDWMGELLSLVDAVKVGIDSFAYDFVGLPEGTDYFRVFLNEFKTNTEGYKENLDALDKIKEFIASSKILGEVLSTSLIYTYIYTSLNSAVANLGAELIFENNINYANSYDANGNIAEYGELYYLTNAIAIVAKEESILNNVESLIYDLKTDEELEASVMDLITMLNKETNEGTIVDNLGSSSIGQSMLSCLIYSEAFGDVNIGDYIDSRLLEVGEDDKPINLIKKEEIKDLLKLVPEALPMINEFMDKLEITTDDVLSLLDDPRFETLFDSRLLESVVSGFALANLPETDMLVIPKHPNLITIDDEVSELRQIYDILKLNIIDLEVVLNATDASAYLDMIEALTDEDIDTVLSSKIIYYSINNAVMSLELSENVGIIAPNTVTTELKDENIKRVINIDEFKRVFKLLPALIPADMSAIDPNEILTTIAFNKDEILESDVLTATIANYIVNGLDTGGIITIPQNLVDAVEPENLVEKYGSNPWPHELDSFVLALDEVLDITGSGSVDIDSIQDDILNQVNYLNDPARLDSSKTKLDLLYESNIITGVLSAQVDAAMIQTETNPNGLFDTNDLFMLKDKETGLYKKSEFSSLIHMLSIFGIQLDTLLNDPSYDAIGDIIGNIDILNDYYNEKETNLDYLYHSNLLGVLLNEVMTDSGLSIPAEARYPKTNVIKKEEAKGLLSLNSIFPSLTEFSLESIDLESFKNNKEAISGSTIFSANIYNQLKDLNEIVIPAKAIIGAVDKYINSEELGSFIDVITNENNANLLFNQNADGSYNLSEVKQIDLDSLNTDTLRSLTASSILEGTCIMLLGSNEDLKKNLPDSYKNSVDKNSLANDENNIWITNDEIGKLIDAIDAIMATSNITSIGGLTDAEAIKDYIDNGALITPVGNNRASIEIAYESIIIKANVSSMLDDVLTAELIDQSIKSNTIVIKEDKEEYSNLYRASEIVALLRVMSNLGIEIKTISNFDIDALIENDKEGNLFNTIYNSYILAGILTKQIDNSLVKLISSESYNRDTVKEEVNEITRYKVEELNNLLSTITNPKLGLGSLSNITFNEKTELTVAKIDAIYDGGSYLMRYVIAEALDKALTSDLIDQNLLSKAKDEDETYYQQAELGGLINVLNEFGIKNMDSFKNIDVNFNNLNESLYNESLLARGIITTQVKNIAANGITVPSIAYSAEGTLNWTELNAIKSLANTDGSFNGIDDMVLDENNITAIAASAILNANITAKINDIATFVIPNRAYNSSYTGELLTTAELGSLLRALSVLNLNLGDPDISTLTPRDVEDKLSTLTNSDIIRATISKFIVDAGVNNGAAFNASLDSIEEVIVGATVECVLTASEIESFIAALNVVNDPANNSYGLALDLNVLKNLSSANVYKVFKSSIAANLLSDFILETGLYEVTFPYTSDSIQIENEFGDKEDYKLVKEGMFTYHFHAAIATRAHSFNTNSEIDTKNITAKDVLAFVSIVDSLPI